MGEKISLPGKKLIDLYVKNYFKKEKKDSCFQKAGLSF
jgi:hypothetical protein